METDDRRGAAAAEPEQRDDTEEEPGHPFWPTHVLDQVIIVYLLAGVVLTLSVLLPFRLHGQADPLHTPEGIKPEWYFLAAYQLLKYVPKSLGVTLCGVAVSMIVIWPFLDSLIERRWGPRAYRRIGVLGLAIVLFLGLAGWISERTVTLLGQKYHIDLLGIPHKATDTRSVPAGSEGGEPSAEQDSTEGSAR